MRKILFIVLASVITVSAVAVGISTASTNTVFINMASVYEQFQLSQERHKELEKVFKTRKHILDSLYENLKTMSGDIQRSQGNKTEAIKEFKKLEEEYLYKEKTFDDENRSAIEKTDAEIWQQITLYTEKFGKKMDYDYILGANSQGNIMYAKDKKNVTKELIDFLNANYDDKIK